MVIAIIPCQAVVEIATNQCFDIGQTFSVTIRIVQILPGKAGIRLQRSNDLGRRCPETDGVEAFSSKESIEAAVTT
jgi:hypothetical protein